jgi:hypothetical protein
MSEETTVETAVETVQLTPVEARQAEVNAYSANIKNYENILATINGEWDKDLAHLKNVEAQEAARQCSMERLQRLAELQLHDQVKNLLKTEIVERAKAQIILTSLLNS